MQCGNTFFRENDLVIEEVPLSEDITEALIAMSMEWESENSCHGYRRNTMDDLIGNRVFVARSDREIVGYLLGHIETSEKDTSIMPSGTRYFEVEELYVRPDLRSKGIGRALFLFVKEKVDSEAAYMMLGTATKDWRSILHFYIDELGMEFWSARLFQRIL